MVSPPSCVESSECSPVAPSPHSPLRTLVEKSEDQDSHPVRGVVHKEKGVPTQAHCFLFHLKSEGRSTWALGQGFQKVCGTQPHVHADPAGRTFQDREASPQVAWLQGDPDLPLRRGGSSPGPQGSPLPQSPVLHVFPKPASLDGGPGVGAKAGRSFAELTQGPSA